MEKTHKFTDLQCWQSARELVKQVYLLTREGAFSKDYGLRDQIQRSAVSIMANIAEGFGTYSDLEFIRFLGYSVRSCSEVQSHLYVALDIEYMNQHSFNEITKQVELCEKLTRGMIRYLKNK